VILEEELRIRQKDFEREAATATKVQARDSQARFAFKARNMPYYCQPGRYAELIEEPFRRQKERRGEVDRILSEEKRPPYYVCMPKRFHDYERYKLQKQELLNQRSLEDIDPNCTFKPALNPQPFGNDYGKYFSQLQLQFQEKLVSQKALAKKISQNENLDVEKKALCSHLERRQHKHFCLYKGFEGSEREGHPDSVSQSRCRSAKRLGASAVQLEVGRHMIARSGKTHDHFHTNCVPKGESIPVKMQEERERGYIVRPHEHPHALGSIGKHLVEREELLTAEQLRRRQKEHKVPEI
jgi:hypothetical protein